MSGPRPPAVLLVNPRARRAAAACGPAVTGVLGTRYAVEVVTPASPEALAAAARDAARAGAAVVFTAGGDGTARLAAAALAGSPCALGILPAGTANDGARALGIPPDLAGAAAHLAAAEPRPVDLVDAGAGVFYTVGGIGVVAAAARRAAALRAGAPWARGVAAVARAGVYRLAAAGALLSGDSAVRRYAVSYLTPAGVRRDDTIAAHGAFAATLPFCGGGLRVPGTGAPDDGVFELCFVAPAPRPALAARFARLAAGLPVPPGAVRVIAVREAHLACDAPDHLIGDGEALAAGRVFHLRAMPRALWVLA